DSSDDADYVDEPTDNSEVESGEEKDDKSHSKRKHSPRSSDEDRPPRKKKTSAFARFEDAPPKLAVHPAVEKYLLGKDRLNHLKVTFTTDHAHKLHRRLRAYAFHTEVTTLKTPPTLFSDMMKSASSHFRGRDQQSIINDLKAQQKNLDNADEFALLGLKGNILTAHLLQTALDDIKADLTTPDELIAEIRSAVELVHGIDITKRPASSEDKPPAPPTAAAGPPPEQVEPPAVTEEPEISPEETALDMVHQLTLALLRVQRKVSKHLQMVEEALDTAVLNTLHAQVITSDFTVQKVRNVLKLADPKAKLISQINRSGGTPVWSGTRPTLPDGTYDFSKPLELIAAKDVPMLDTAGRELSSALTKVRATKSKPFSDSANPHRGRGKSTRYSYSRGRYQKYRGGFKSQGGYKFRNSGYYGSLPHDGYRSYNTPPSNDSSPTPGTSS
ncbi:hypothetical protein HDU93_004589, partial [Gonapodya sp. JEL0774]